ncbi:hypothetical protein [Fundidesulfovibrio soli]|uniref:hypothetical protein n=1 Tax=Fundidesulfovibrio soli TaxID=2922716 RepID=UPI001FAF40C4|nr:hypothetical protein [Fundidesulfovibrio soli]
MSTISGLSTSQSYASSLVTGTTQTADTASAAEVAGLSTEDKAKISQGAKRMNQLSQLAGSDPEKFKEVAQTISDGLAEEAKNATDSRDAKMLTEMSAKFADAAKTGSMDSLKMEKPKGPPMGSGGNGNGNGNAASKFAGAMRTDNPMAAMDAVIDNALSGVGTTDSGTSTASSAAA